MSRLHVFLNDHDNKWKQDSLSLEAAILVLDEIFKSKGETVDLGEIETARNGLLKCMFTDLPSNVFYDALKLHEAENNDE